MVGQWFSLAGTLTLVLASAAADTTHSHHTHSPPPPSSSSCLYRWYPLTPQLNHIHTPHTPQGTKVSVNDFVMRAAALALRDTPAANAFWDKAGERSVQQPSVDVCVAVATDGGLITPIVKAADTKSLTQVGGEQREGAIGSRGDRVGLLRLFVATQDAFLTLHNAVHSSLLAPHCPHFST